MKKDKPLSKDIINFIQLLIVPSGSGEGKPFKLLPFQKRFIRDVYDPVGRDGKRIVRRAILSMARKNGKTMMVACLALAHLLIDRLATKNGEIYSLGNDRDQASIVFRYAAQIVRADQELLSYIKIVDSTKTMICMKNGSVYRALSAEVGTKFGLNPTVAIVDELAQAKNRDLYDAFDTSMGAREQPLLIVISTQSNDPQHPLSILIDDGISRRDPSIVCHLYDIPDDSDDEEVLSDPKLWAKANPALGKFRSLPEMRSFARKAKRMPSYESTFKNLYCNMRIDAESPFIPRAEWVACHGNSVIEAKSSIYLGLDLSATTDLTALAAVSAGDKDIVKAWFWKPEKTLIEHEKRDRVPYTVWKNQGYIETCPGAAIDYDWVVEKIRKVADEYVIMGLAFDRWGIKYLLKYMNDVGIPFYIEGKEDKRTGALRLVDWGQGFVGMKDAVTALETSILNRKLIHNGNPVLTWNFSNAIIEMDAAGCRKFSKNKSRFRIDGVQACAMAIGLKSRDLIAKPRVSKYEREGIRVI